MSFFVNLFLILGAVLAAAVVLAGYGAKKAAQNPETAGGIAKFLLGLFKK